MKALSPRAKQFLAVLLCVLVLGVLWWARLGGEDAANGGADSSSSSPSSSAGTDADSGLRVVAVADLPEAARETVRLIDAGGPFPYSRDGITFRNAEGILPEQPVGYYREYTVPTPGSSDRGARRIVAARSGTLFYTDDHYASFRKIDRGGVS